MTFAVSGDGGASQYDTLCGHATPLAILVWPEATSRGAYGLPKLTGRHSPPSAAARPPRRGPQVVGHPWNAWRGPTSAAIATAACRRRLLAVHRRRARRLQPAAGQGAFVAVERSMATNAAARRKHTPLRESRPLRAWVRVRDARQSHVRL